MQLPSSGNDDGSCMLPNIGKTVPNWLVCVKHLTYQKYLPLRHFQDVYTCVQVCMVCVYTCAQVCTVCVYTCAQVCMVCVCTCKCASVYGVCVQVQVCKCVRCVCAHASVQVCSVCVCTCVNMHACVHVLVSLCAHKLYMYMCVPCTFLLIYTNTYYM